MAIKDDLTYRVIGCAMEVHNVLGNGFQEVIYQRCRAIEFEKQNISFQREVEQPLFYKENAVGSRRADFIVENKIILELKAVIALEDIHLAQAKNYLTAYNFDIGLLINFGSLSLDYKRIFRTEKKVLHKTFNYLKPVASHQHEDYPDHSENQSRPC
jgi:GxxExxY protein